MKFKLSSWQVAVMTLLLALAPASAAGKKADFLQFVGKFRGTTGLVFTGAGYSGPAALSVRASKDGSSAAMVFSGSVDSSGTTVPFSGTLLFTLGNVSLNEVLFNIEGNNGGVVGKYRLSKNKVTYSGQGLVGSSPGTLASFSGTIRTSQNKRHQKIVFTYTLSVGSSVYFYNANLTRKIKPEK